MTGARPHDRPATRRTAGARGRRAGFWLCGVLAAAVALSGCTTDGTTDASPPALPDGVTVDLRQLRSDVAARQAQVTVMNGSDQTLTVGAVEVHDPRFDGLGVRVVDRESRISAGGSVSIRVQLPPAACPGDDQATASVTLDWSTADAAGTATSDLPDPLEFVPPLHERECRASALAAAADLTLSSFTPSPEGSPAVLTLTIAPAGNSAAVIDGIHMTNLLAWPDTPGLVRTIGAEVRAGDTEPIQVELPLVPARCDPHVVQEDKRGTVFTLDVEIDGSKGTIELPASEEMRGRILTWVAQWCRFGG